MFKFCFTDGSRRSDLGQSGAGIYNQTTGTTLVLSLGNTQQFLKLKRTLFKLVLIPSMLKRKRRLLSAQIAMLR